MAFTTCGQPQLKLYCYFCYYDLGLRPFCGAGCRKLRPNLAHMLYQPRPRFSRQVRKGVAAELWKVVSKDVNMSIPFTTEELVEGRQSPRTRWYPPRVSFACRRRCNQVAVSVYVYLFGKMENQKKIWRKATVIALPKRNKPKDDPKSYRSISLLCIPFKLLERMIHGRINPIIDPQLPHEQAGFRKGRLTVDQVTLLTQDIEDCFEAKGTAGAVLVDLTAAYDTVWHRGLILKLLQMLQDKHMVHLHCRADLKLQVCAQDQRRTAKADYADSKWCSLEICPGPIAVQHLHPWPSWYHLQEVWLRQWPSHPNSQLGMEEDWNHPKPGHEHLGPIPHGCLKWLFIDFFLKNVTFYFTKKLETRCK